MTSSPVICQRRLSMFWRSSTLTRHPVDRGGDLVLVASLERVDDAENLGSVATSGSRVREDSADGLLGVNDED